MRIRPGTPEELHAALRLEQCAREAKGGPVARSGRGMRRWGVGRRDGMRGGGGARPDPLARLISILGPTARIYYSHRGVSKDGSDLVAGVADAPQGLYSVTQGTPTNQPKYRASVAALNNRAALEYRHDGSNGSFLQDDTASDWRFLHESGSTIVAVCRSTEVSPTGSRYLLCTRSGGGIGARINLNSTTQDLQWVVTTSAGTHLVATASGVGLTMRVIVARHADAAAPDYDLRVNGSSHASGNYAFGAPPSGEDPDFALRIGAISGLAAPWIGDVALIAAVPSYLSDEDVSRVESILLPYYGVT